MKPTMFFILILSLTEALAQNCILETNTKYYGNDIGSISASSSNDCCILCSVRSGCTSFTYNSLNRSCLLKNPNPTYINRIKNDFYSTSGIINTSVPTTTAITPCNISPGPTGTCPSYYENDIDYNGNDLSYSFSPSPEACCGICLNTNSCTGFTYVSFFQICWLKNFTSMPKNRFCSKGRISSIVSTQLTSSTNIFQTTTSGQPIITYTLPTGITGLTTTYRSSSLFTTISTITSFTQTDQPLTSVTRPSTETQFTLITQTTLVTQATTQITTNAPTPFISSTLPFNSNCDIETNIRYNLNKFAESSIPSADFCCEICLATPLCKAFTYLLNTQMCNLMKSVPVDTQRIDDTNALSGLVNA